NNARFQRSRHLAEVTAAEAGSDLIEARVIPDVEELRAKLDLGALTERKVLEEGPVPGVLPRSANQSCPTVPEEAEGRVGKSARVKPLRQTLVAGNTADTIRPGGQRRACCYLLSRCVEVLDVA